MGEKYICSEKQERTKGFEGVLGKEGMEMKKATG
jgi:hypothetical protein